MFSGAPRKGTASLFRVGMAGVGLVTAHTQMKMVSLLYGFTPLWLLIFQRGEIPL